MRLLSSPMKFYVGTSGFSYKPWKGKFYPRDLPEKEMLKYYSSQFNAVEINSSFYRMPKESVLETWARDVPEGFKFIIKGPQKITHFQRLRETKESVDQLLNVIGVLNHRLGPLLFQTPPNLKKDIPLLQSFLTLFPLERRLSFEFRHESWFHDDLFNLLRERQAALCFAEADEGVQVPFESTTDWGYLRLRRAEYTDAELKTWAGRIHGRPWKEVFVFFKHEDEAKGPAMAKRLLDLA